MKIIDKLLNIDKKAKALEAINPRKFTPIDLKKFFKWMPIWFIKFLCEMAVKQELYNKFYINGNFYYSLNEENKNI